MASDQTLRAIISVDDRTLEPIRRINERFAQMRVPLRDISSRVSALAEETGLKTVGEHAKEAFGRVRELGSGVLELLGQTAALGGAASLGGLVEIAKSTAEFAEQIGIGSKMTGIATDKLAGWHYAAGLVNLDADRLDRGFTYLNRSIAEAASGKAKDVQAILTHMGVANTPQHMVSTAEALQKISAEVKHLVDSGQIQLATSIMDKFFGERQGQALLPLFEEGPAALSKTLGEAKEAGISLTASQAAAGARFMDEWKGMMASVKGLQVAIGDGLLPVLTPVIDGFREWLNDHRVAIARDITDAVNRLSDGIKRINWDKVRADFKGFGEDAKWIFDRIGGVQGALIGIAAIKFGPTIAEFTRLGGAIAVSAGKLLLFPAAQFIGAAASLVPAIRDMRDVWAALDVAMNANPIGAAVAGFTVVAGISYEIYQHWEWIEKNLERVSHLFDRLLGGGRPFYDPFSGKTVGGPAGAAGPSGRGSLPSAASSPYDPLIGSSLLSQHRAALAAAAGASGAGGHTTMTVDFKNVPHGTAISTESRGNATPPDLNVGYSFWGR